MKEGKPKGSNLVIFEDGTLYHIDLKRADNIPPNLFLVGSAERVDTIAKHFDSLTFEHQNKARPEFRVAAGLYKNIPMAALSVGIGTDNNEIALNELHALFEYDHISDTWIKIAAPLNIIRIGTSGTLLSEIPPGAIAISSHSIGLDNLGNFYPPINPDIIAEKIQSLFLQTKIGKINPSSYSAGASKKAVSALEQSAKELGEKEPLLVSGITISSPGFFGPEGRNIGRIKTSISFEEFAKILANFNFNGLKIVNIEMESSLLFRLAYEILGYNVSTICVILDNLSTGEFIDKKYADLRMDQCIKIALEAMVKLVKCG